MKPQIMEIWNYKGFWVGTVADGHCANIALAVAVHRWKFAIDEKSVVYCSKDWNFTKEAAIQFHEDFKAGKLILHKIGFDDWNEVAQKWRKKRPTKTTPLL